MNEQIFDEIYGDNDNKYSTLSKELYRSFCIMSVDVLEKIKSERSVKNSVDDKFQLELITVLRWIYIFILTNRRNEKPGLEGTIKEFWEIDSSISGFTGRDFRKAKKFIDKRFARYSRAIVSLQPFQKLSEEFLSLIGNRSNYSIEYFSSLFNNIYVSQNALINVLIKKYY